MMVLKLLLLVGISLATVGGGINTFRRDFFDPSLLRIDEGRYLGNFVADVEVVLEDGRRERLYKLVSESPTVLVLTYYTCGGSCPLRVENLRDLISKTSLRERDFRVLVLSFDRRDTLEDLRRFKETHGPFTRHWVFGLLPEEEVERLTRSIGFKFFYSERDRTFVHTNVYVFLSPEGRITRFLFGVKPEERDVRVALAEARSGEVSLSSLMDLALLVCYTYDPSRSRFVVNPALVLGGMGFSLLGGVVLYVVLAKKLTHKEV